MRFLLVSILFPMALSLTAQEAVKAVPTKKDTNTIISALKTGEVQLHARYFFCNTINEGALSDYYANATSVALGYTSNKHKKVIVGISGFSFFNLGSSNMQHIDALSNQPNRYEIGLFDIDHPGDYSHPARLDEIYVRLNLKKEQVRFGRQFINTPLINEQDGRLRGTSVGGLYMESTRFKNTTIYAAWLTEISPRSTTEWYRVSSSIGVNSQGVSPTGIKANYRNHVATNGVGFIGVKIRVFPTVEWQVWDYVIDNVMNTVFTQLNYNRSLKKDKKIVLAGQVIKQTAINNGGHFNQEFAYTPKGAQALTFGGKLALQTKQCEWSINFNSITKQGRYVFPREWGRDPFFTFLQRERNEGSGGSRAIAMKFDYISKNKTTQLALGVSYVTMPDVMNFALNKYGLPSYFQWNSSLKYDFKKWLPGLEGQLLMVVKTKTGETYQQPKYEINKVNLLLTNLIINYHFK